MNNRFNGNSINASNILETAKNHLKEYFISGDTEQGIIDLRLDIIGTETLTADCDVTDHYTESNTAYQDQISIKPRIYTIEGEVGELVWYQKDSVSQVVGQVAQRLEGIISFLPIRSKSFNQMKKTAMKAAQWVDTGSNILSRASNLLSLDILNEKGDKTGSRSLSNQEQAYIYLVGFRDNRTLLTIQTPWGVLKNYVIMNLKFTQPRETKDKSIISITLKEIRLTQIETVKFDANKFQGNAVYENQPQVDNGKTRGEDASLPKVTEIAEDGSEYETCRVGSGDEIYEVEYSDKYGFSVLNPETMEYYSHDSQEYKTAVAEATNECNNIIGQLK